MLAVTVRKGELSKNLKYLVMVFDRGHKRTKRLDKNFSFEDYQPDRYSGFLSREPQQTIGIFLVGKEKHPHGDVIVQLPKVFNTLKEAKERIKQHKKMHKAFKENNRYEIVPIEHPTQ